MAHADAAIGLMSSRVARVAAGLALVMLGLSVLTLLVGAEAMFSLFPLVFTLGGQHVLNNLILLGAGMVMATAVSDPRPWGAAAPAMSAYRQTLRGVS